MQIKNNNLSGLKLIQYVVLLSLIAIVQVQAQTQVLQDRTSLQQPSSVTPKGLTDDEWANIRTQMTAQRYHAHAHDDGGFISANPAHHWSIRYAANGTTTLTPNNRTSHFRLSFKLNAIGYAQLNKLLRPDAISTQASNVYYQWTESLQERWINSASELEQWFVLKQAPVGATEGHPLTLQMTLDTDMDIQLVENTLHFTAANGEVIHYDKLKVWDATGRVLPATMQIAEQTLSLMVNDAGVVYPLTIDPSLQKITYLKASNTDTDPAFTSLGSTTFGKDRFASSVAISGNTLVVGAPEEDSDADGVNGDQNNNAGLDAGAAYVFVHNGENWIQQAYLKASNSNRSDRFGSSVAIEGNTIVIGAPYEDSNASGINGDEANNSSFSAGAVYIFQRSGENWHQQAYLKASPINDGTRHSQFGFSVAISDDTVIVGAPNYENGFGTLCATCGQLAATSTVNCI